MKRYKGSYKAKSLFLGRLNKRVFDSFDPDPDDYRCSACGHCNEACFC